MRQVSTDCDMFDEGNVCLFLTFCRVKVVEDFVVRLNKKCHT